MGRERERGGVRQSDEKRLERHRSLTFLHRAVREGGGGREGGRETDRQTDRHTHTHTHTQREKKTRNDGYQQTERDRDRGEEEEERKMIFPH